MSVLISVITINFNDAIGLINTLDSFRKSLDVEDRVELIVIDGASTDNSLEVIKANSNIITKYISESDDGIYYAMNKGIKHAKGDSIIFMNSGDEFSCNFSFDHFLKFVSTNKFTLKNDIFAGNNLIKIGKVFFLRELNGTEMPCHQAMFVPRQYLIDGFDCSYRICSDLKMNLKLVNDYGYKKYDRLICTNSLGGVSNNWPSYKRLNLHYHELIRIYNLSKLSKCLLYFKLVIKKVLIDLFGYKFFYGFLLLISNKK